MHPLIEQPVCGYVCVCVCVCLCILIQYLCWCIMSFLQDSVSRIGTFVMHCGSVCVYVSVCVDVCVCVTVCVCVHVCVNV